MTRRTFLLFLGLAAMGMLAVGGVLSPLQGCSNCSPTVDEPIPGEYRLAEHEDADPPDLIAVVEDDHLILEYTRPDGARYRVTYEIGEKVQ